MMRACQPKSQGKKSGRQHLIDYKRSDSAYETKTDEMSSAAPRKGKGRTQHEDSYWKNFEGESVDQRTPPGYH